MNTLNCRKCGKLFTTHKSILICPACEKKEEETFKSVKEYIDNNPNCTMAQLSEATKVSAKKILSYIREGRLEISSGMKGEVECQSCGIPITMGKYCEKCKIKIVQDISEMFRDNKAEGPKMHTRRKSL